MEIAVSSQHNALRIQKTIYTRLQISDQIVHFFRLQSVLEARHVRAALQNKSSQNFHLIRTGILKLPAKAWPDHRRRAKFQLSGEMANRAALQKQPFPAPLVLRSSLSATRAGLAMPCSALADSASTATPQMQRRSRSSCIVKVRVNSCQASNRNKDNFRWLFCTARSGHCQGIRYLQLTEFHTIL